uniref:Uncharacterized protein n=1 Tax=Panagrolaimus davidi TaxID=227884 RepID=A0A914PVK0_9BILA
MKRLEDGYERERKENARLLEDNEQLKEDKEYFKREFELTENEADQLVVTRDKLEAENEDLQNKNDKLGEEIQELKDKNKSLDIKCKTMKKAIDEIAEKFTVENQGKIIEEIKGSQKLPVPNKSAQPLMKPRSRLWALGNATLPNR